MLVRQPVTASSQHQGLMMGSAASKQCIIVNERERKRLKKFIVVGYLQRRESNEAWKDVGERTRRPWRVCLLLPVPLSFDGNDDEPPNRPNQ